MGDKLAPTTQEAIGVQGQIFTIINDEAYYYPDLIRGMIVLGDYGKSENIAKYTGSTTGTSRSNEVCSGYTPITWQVDRKCHYISASSFDKMCADMKNQLDDMSSDLHAHGARETVDDIIDGRFKRRAVQRQCPLDPHSSHSRSKSRVFVSLHVCPLGDKAMRKHSPGADGNEDFHPM